LSISWRWTFALGLAALMGACAPRAVQAPVESVEPVPPPQAQAPRDCYEALTRMGARFEPRQTNRTAEGCLIAEPVMLERATIPLSRPALMTCPLAHALAAFEREVVQQAAQRHFNRPVQQIVHFGAYVCRPQTGRADRLSEHGFGRAIDIGGFELAGNIRVSVRDHWRDRGPRGAFLREVAQGACRHFNMVLTPKTDAAHAAHFHLDMGRFKRCDA
jgi:hypothetical protein